MKIWGSRAPLYRVLAPAPLVAVLLFPLLALGPAAGPVLAADDSLGFFEARRLEKQAEAAAAAGRSEEAAELYLRLAEGSDPGNRQARALYGHAVGELSGPAGSRDEAAARRSLDRLLSSYSGHESLPSARALLSLLDAGGPAPVSAPPPPAEPAKTAASDGTARDLESRVRQLEAQLAATREELAQKEEALRKLKDLVVEGGGR